METMKKYQPFYKALDALISGTTQQIARKNSPFIISLQKGSRDISKEDTVGIYNVAGVPFHLFEMGGKDTATRMPQLTLTTKDINRVLRNEVYIPSMVDLLAEDWAYIENLPEHGEPIDEQA